jgi:uncharacterized membrane protein YfcA
LGLPVEVLYALSGLFVGFVVGLTGVGGGSLMTPLLVLFFGVHPITAVGTDLLYASVTKSAGTLVHGLNKSVDWRIVVQLALGSVPAAAFTLWLLSVTDVETSGMTQLFTIGLGSMLLLTAVSLIFRNQLTRFASTHNELPPLPRAMLTTAFGAVIGILVSISSVGAGAIGVTVLILLYPRLSVHRIISSDIAHAVPLTLVAGAGHWFIGNVDWHMLLALLAGSVPGILISSRLAPRIDERIIRWALAVVLLLVGARLVLS